MGTSDDADFNRGAAEQLARAADLLEQQGANPFRINAFRRAASTVAGLDTDLRRLVRSKGVEFLQTLPGIGRGIADAIVEMVATGRWRRLERLRGELDPNALFRTIPGVGPTLAERIHDTLHVDTLEALEAEAARGRLREIPGVGPRRERGIQAALASMLGQPFRRAAMVTAHPGVGVILDVDRQYRAESAAGRLPRIAPRRFNPEGQAWLPILHTSRGEWHFTVLYSNTARAHELGRTGDWVVIYLYDDHHREGQCTVVTERRGPLAGRRVVRGRETECGGFYERSGERNPDASPAR